MSVNSGILDSSSFGNPYIFISVKQAFGSIYAMKLAHESLICLDRLQDMRVRQNQASFKTCCLDRMPKLYAFDQLLSGLLDCIELSA